MKKLVFIFATTIVFTAMANDKNCIVQMSKKNQFFKRLPPPQYFDYRVTTESLDECVAIAEDFFTKKPELKLHKAKVYFSGDDYKYEVTVKRK